METVTTDGRLESTGVAVETAALDELRGSVGEQLVSPGDPGYDQARRVWNGMIDRRPGLIVRCRGVADVVAAVRFARTHQLPLAVRGGGHNVAGFGTCDGGVVVDLSPMRDVRVDAAARTARAAGGATWADLDRETQLFGLAAPGGVVSTTGIAGLTLGGGQGWLRRTYGMACDSLISADVVTADGEVVIASERDNADLFWALRGGGGNFGVVTSFEYQLHPVGPMVAFAGPVYPLESAVTVIGEMRRFAADAPDELNISATLWTIPTVDAFPAELHGRAVVIVGAIYVGAPDHGEPVLEPLREIEEPLMDLSGVVPYTALQQMFDPFFPAGGAPLLEVDLPGRPRRRCGEHCRRLHRVEAVTDVDDWALGPRRGVQSCRCDGDRQRCPQRTVRPRDPRQLDRPQPGSRQHRLGATAVRGHDHLQHRQGQLQLPRTRRRPQLRRAPRSATTGTGSST